MPDILIRGMEMPKNCGACYLNHGEFCFMLCRKLKLPQDWDKRPDACPLHELPEHGDLILRDELLESLRESVDACHKWIDEMRATGDERMVEIAQQSHATFIEAILRVKAMPVIVPASEEVES